MKKCVLILMLLIFCFPAYAAELQDMTFEELISMRNNITQEITSRPEWKEVTVPIGVYEIGIDIPAGHWTISVDQDVSFCTVVYGSELNKAKTEIEVLCENFAGVQLGKDATWGNGLSVSMELHEGDFLAIAYSSVLFTPYMRPALSF